MRKGKDKYKILAEVYISNGKREIKPLLDTEIYIMNGKHEIEVDVLTEIYISYG